MNPEREPRCANCGEIDDLAACSDCGKLFCSECIDWCCDEDDEANGDWFCELCAAKGGDYAGDESPTPEAFDWICEWCGSTLTERDPYCPCKGYEPQIP